MFGDLCILNTCVAILSSFSLLGKSLTGKIKSNLLIKVGGKSICGAIGWYGSNLPNFGFAAAKTVVRARKVAWMFAFDIEMVLWRIKPSLTNALVGSTVTSYTHSISLFSKILIDLIEINRRSLKTISLIFKFFSRKPKDICAFFLNSEYPSFFNNFSHSCNLVSSFFT